jgi:glycosyltransferase involved in cell wall biosynthesis
MNIEKPLFSIVVPIYNEEQFIHEALDSIAAQTDPDWEALLIDDGSTDSTPGILDEYAERDSRFRVIHKSNGGQSSAINLGVQESKGAWLCWLSGDDYFHPQKLEMNRRWIQDYPETHFFFTGFWLIEPNGKKIEYPLDWLELENPAYHLIQILRNNWVMGISICIKRETWLKTGEFDGRLRYAHDLDMWVRLMLNTPNRYLPERTCTMRYHPGQETARFPLAPAFDAAKILIRLVNEHSFKELFPFVDLNDRNIAKVILSRTINFVLSVPDANIYRLGYHPLVNLRILEWIWDPAIDPLLREELRNIILDRAPDFIAFYNDSPFGLLWKATVTALKIDQPHFTYFPCPPDKVGEINYYLQQVEHTEVAQPLRTYLEQNDNVHFIDAPANIKKTGQLILLLPLDISLDEPLNPNFKLFREIWQNLSRTGFSVLLLGKSQYTIGIVDGLIYLGAENELLQNQLLTALGDFDTAIAFSQPERLKWVKAERSVSFIIPAHFLSGSELSAVLTHQIQATPRKFFKRPFVKKFLGYASTMYHILLPSAFREKAQLGQRLRSLRAKL